MKKYLIRVLNDFIDDKIVQFVQPRDEEVDLFKIYGKGGIVHLFSYFSFHKHGYFVIPKHHTQYVSIYDMLIFDYRTLTIISNQICFI